MWSLITVILLAIAALYIFSDNDGGNQYNITGQTTTKTTATTTTTNTKTLITKTTTGPTGPHLTFKTPEEWESPLIVSSTPQATKSSKYSDQDRIYIEGQDIYISFCWQNDGTETLPYPVIVELYYDDMLVYSNLGNALQSHYYSKVTDWDDLPSLVGLHEGAVTHQLAVYLFQYTDQGLEEVENLSVYFDWDAGLASSFSAPLGRKPNLTPFHDDGWDDVIVASSSKDTITGDQAVSGPLSVDADTYLGYSIKNDGLSSVIHPFWVFTYVDDILVSRMKWDDLRCDYESWGRLSLDERLKLSPGEHRVRVIVDATNLISEADESDNEYQQTFVWKTGPVVVPLLSDDKDTLPVAVAPPPLTLPNLVPYYGYPEFFWQPMNIIVDGQRLETPLEKPGVSEQSTINLVVYNESCIPTNNSFNVALYFDDYLVHNCTRNDVIPANKLVYWDWDGLKNSGRLTTGEHTLTMVVDPDNRIAEANESDNTFEMTLTWYEVTGGYYIPSTETKTQLAGLVGMLDLKGLCIEQGTDRRYRVLDMASDAYYLVTGTSLEREPVQINLLTGADFRQWTDEYYKRKFAIAQAAEYPGILKKREERKYVNRAYECQRFGSLQIVIDSERTTADLFCTIIHESGHMRQDILNYDQPDQTLNEQALHEAEAYTWEATVIRAVEEEHGLSLSAYPDISDYRSYVDYQVGYLVDNHGSDEHWMGKLLTWGAVLADDVPGLRQELLSNGRLSSASANHLYEFFVNLPYNTDDYVNSRVNYILSDKGEQIKEIIKGRLVPELNGDLEGSPDLAWSLLLSP